MVGRDQPCGVGEHVVDVLEHVVGHRAAVAPTAVDRAAGGVEAQARLAAARICASSRLWVTGRLQVQVVVVVVQPPSASSAMADRVDR